MAQELTRRRADLGLQVLASIFQRPALFFVVEEIVAGDHFVEPAHRKLWSEMQQVNADGEGIDIATLMSRGSDPGILMALETAPSVSAERELRSIARTLAETWLQATLAPELQLIGRRAESIDPMETVEGLIRVVERANRTFAAGNRTSLRTHLDEYLKSLDETATGARVPIPTGMSTLDSILFGGFLPGDFVTVGGMPGTGKTGLCLNFTHTQLEAGVHVGFIEAEMTRNEIFAILNAIYSRATTDTVKSGRECATVNLPFASWMYEKQFEFAQVHDAQKNLRALTGIIESYARIGCKIVYIDFLQIFRARGNAKITEYDGVSHLVSTLRSLAMRLKLCIVAIASNNRDSYDKSNRPTLHSFRGSGEIEYNATRAIQLHRTTNDAQECGGDRGIDLMLLKNRSGRTGIIGLNFHLPTQRLTEVSSGYSARVPNAPPRPHPTTSEEDEGGF